MTTGFEQDPHSQAGNACPRNSFGIVDYAELQAIETVYVMKRREELAALGVTGKFDPDHLRAIHRYLFQDIFPWAGQFRVVVISKGTTTFGPPAFIAGALTEVLAKLKTEGFLKGLSTRDFAARAAFYLSKINAIHSFREGNGAPSGNSLVRLA